MGILCKFILINVFELKINTNFETPINFSFPWSKVKPFIRGKLELVMDNFYRDHPLTETQIRVPNCKPFDYDNTKNEIMKSFDWFYAAPFTIQRLCELLVEPGKHYHRTDKLMRCIEKNILVVSTVQPRSNKYATPETFVIHF